VRFSGGEAVFPELSKQQREILKALNVDVWG